MTISEPQDKYLSLQILRAIAAWMVVYHHFMQMYYDFKSDTAVGYFFTTFGSFGVDLFFVLSGFVMYFSAKRPHQTAGTFITDRIFRIVPVYWFYTFAILAVIYFFPNEFYYTDANARSVLASLFFIPHRNPSGIGIFPTLTVGWTLNFEMFFYVILTLCILVSKRFSLTICSIALIVLPNVYPKNVVFSAVATNHRLHEFLVGMLIASLIYFAGKKYRISVIGRITLILTLLSIVIAIAIAMQDSGTKRTMIAGIFVCLTLLCEPIARCHFFITRFLIKLGNESYSTYLSHTLIIGVLLHFTGKPTDQYTLWFVVALISVTVNVVSYASYRWIERNKYFSRPRNMPISPPTSLST